MAGFEATGSADVWEGGDQMTKSTGRTASVQACAPAQCYGLGSEIEVAPRCANSRGRDHRKDEFR